MIRIKELRNEKKQTLKQMAEAFGTSNQVISRYELGQAEPDFETLIKIADYFNVSVDYLLGRTDKRFTSDKTFTSEQLRLLNAFDALIPPMQEYILEMVEKLVEQPQNTVKRA